MGDALQTVAIAGVGLIGGSFGLALRKRGFPGRIVGISSPRTIQTAIERGAIDEGVTLEAAAADADLIFLAQPISVILETIDALVPLARPNCLVTDAGSTKVRICESASRLPRFLGGHPMAGKEQPGIASADPDLFCERPWILTPPKGVISNTLLESEYLGWIETCGSVPVVLTPQQHDQTVAWTSHLPQLASTCLASVLHSQLNANKVSQVSGPGLRDMTRLALSPWLVWRDILSTNAVAIDHVLGVYIDKLTEMRENLQTQRTGEEFTIAAEIAHKIRRGAQKL